MFDQLTETEWDTLGHKVSRGIQAGCKLGKFVARDVVLYERVNGVVDDLIALHKELCNDGPGGAWRRARETGAQR